MAASLSNRRSSPMRFGSAGKLTPRGATPIVVGRSSLAGDAAHDNSPLGGQGMNTGIGDAVELAGALDAARQSDLPDALDAYARVRRPVVKQIQLRLCPTSMR